MLSLEIDYSAARRRTLLWVRVTQVVVALITLGGVAVLVTRGLSLYDTIAQGGGLEFFRAAAAREVELVVLLGALRDLVMGTGAVCILFSAAGALRVRRKGREGMTVGLVLVAVGAVVTLPKFVGEGVDWSNALALLHAVPSAMGMLFLLAAGRVFGEGPEVEPDYVELVQRVLSQALGVRASDVHFEPGPREVSVRFRIDGVLHTVATYPKDALNRLISRMKVMANMDIAERRLPQDGGATLQLSGRDVDLRISTVPSSYGERAVIRLLDREAGLLGLEGLGLNPRISDELQEIIQRPYGVFFCTGPTGSGKTTTLYAALQRVGSGERHVITVEDPVEYKLPGITQLPVGKRKGMNFASGLRSILRQDPDVIMVGEVRDEETAHMVIEAAQTGHLVLSTLHTKDAAGAVARLLDLQVEPFLLSSCLTAVLAQRLVRCICRYCTEPYKPDRSELQKLGVAISGTPTFHRGTGCSHCMYTGYRGRTGIFELLTMNDAIRDLVTQRASANAIKKAMMGDGVMDLRMHGAQKVLQGITTTEEVLRVT
jgi:type II secretory ATPase GspE/PulE/Tfp pilus assembly ATPase PilB-like protein